ncbi:MAG: hypothetical protein Q9224_007080, partial [Gallowayella concinna]
DYGDKYKIEAAENGFMITGSASTSSGVYPNSGEYFNNPYYTEADIVEYAFLHLPFALNISKVPLESLTTTRPVICFSRFQRPEDRPFTSEPLTGIGYYSWTRLTTSEMEAAFAAHQRQWEASSAKALLEEQMSRILRNTHINKVVAFALGSLQRVGDTVRRGSNLQLAALITIMNCISKNTLAFSRYKAFLSSPLTILTKSNLPLDNERNETSQKARCYIQDPHFSKNDQHILSTHGITVVYDPDGFNHITDTTLVYMQRAYAGMYGAISEGSSWPAVLICDRLDDGYISAMAARNRSGIDQECARKIEHMMGEYEQEDFPQMLGEESEPFHRMRIGWRGANVKEEDGEDDGKL